MAQLGYKIALDDFISSNDWKAFLPFISIIKFDIRLVPIPKAKLFINKLRSMKIEYLAEKLKPTKSLNRPIKRVSTIFKVTFSKPEIIQRKALQPSFQTIVQLLKEVAKPEVDFREIETIVAKDISLSYMLLTFVNSSVTVSSKSNLSVKRWSI